MRDWKKRITLLHIAKKKNLYIWPSLKHRIFLWHKVGWKGRPGGKTIFAVSSIFFCNSVFLAALPQLDIQPKFIVLQLVQAKLTRCHITADSPNGSRIICILCMQRILYFKKYELKISSEQSAVIKDEKKKTKLGLKSITEVGNYDDNTYYSTHIQNEWNIFVNMLGINYLAGTKRAGDISIM